MALQELSPENHLEEVENAWMSRYIPFMTDTVAIMNCYGNDSVDFGIHNGEILFHRNQQETGTYYVTDPEIAAAYNNLGTAFFNIARGNGLFGGFPDWESFDREVIGRINDKPGFMAGIPDILLNTKLEAENNNLQDGIPMEISATFGALIAKAEAYGMRRELEILSDCQTKIDANIGAIKDVYRFPRLKKLPKNFPVSTMLMPGDISYTALDAKKYKNIDQRLVFDGNGVSDQDPDKLLVSMSAEYFVYGPEENLEGNVALITNGASFALETLDRLSRAGIRLGFASDLRLDFSEEKFYWAMKMALENKAVDTIALNVLTTLGSSLDIAKSVERISKEYGKKRPLKFVVKMEGLRQAEGMAYLKKMQSAGKGIVFDEDNLDLDRFTREIKRLEGRVPDRQYETRYGKMDEKTMADLARQAIGQRTDSITNPVALPEEVQKNIDNLLKNGMLSRDHIFGGEYRKAEYGQKFRGRPLVVIFGSGRTTLIQAEISKRAGTEVVIVHQNILSKKDLHRSEDNELWVKIDEAHANIPCFNNVAELKTALKENYTDGNLDMIGIVYEQFKPFKKGESYAERVSFAVDQLMELDPLSILIPSEMIPSNQSRAILKKTQIKNEEKFLQGRNGTIIVGPNSPGFSGWISSGNEQLRVGQIPPFAVSPGDVAVYGVGGTSLFEAVNTLKENNFGTSWAVSIGGDTIKGYQSRDFLLMAENDVNTNFSLVIGEPGGDSINNLVQIMKSGKITKPVVVLLNGYYLPDNCYLGHSGSVSSGERSEWIHTLRRNLIASGAIVVYSPQQATEILGFLKSNPGYARISADNPHFAEAEEIRNNLSKITKQAVIYQLGENRRN